LKKYNIIRRLLNRFGWDIQRYRYFHRLLKEFDIDLVIDVGANTGGYVGEIRLHEYMGRVVSFEPGERAFNVLKEASSQDPLWDCYKLGVGDAEGELMLNVYDHDVYSSFRNLSEHVTFSNKPKTEIVRMVTLDQFMLDNPDLMKARRKFLKVDTQGFEKNVIAGAQNVMDSFSGIMMECSLSRCYDGEWFLEEAFTELRKLGFVPWSMKRNIMKNHRELEYDVIFMREHQIVKDIV